MEGGTIAVGNTTTPNTLTFLSTQFLPAQVATAIANNFNPTVYARRRWVWRLASTRASRPTFGGLRARRRLSRRLRTATGMNAAAIQGFVQNWINFYSGAGSGAHPGLTVQQAAFGAAFGDFGRRCAASIRRRPICRQSSRPPLASIRSVPTPSRGWSRMR